MKLFTVFGVLLAATIMFSCSTDPANGASSVTMTITDHTDALTANAGDNLFTLTVAVSTKSYNVSAIKITAKPVGESATIMNFDHDDTNSDNLVDQGESFTVIEPALNRFDSSTVGLSIEVKLYEDLGGGSWALLATGSWTPAN